MSTETPMARTKRILPSKKTMKAAKALLMLRRDEGATIAQLRAALSWQAHSVRGFLSGALKKQGQKLTSTKLEGAARVYRIVE